MSKGDYQNAIAICRSLGTIPSLQNKLATLSAKTEDKKLAKLLEQGAALLITAHKVAVLNKVGSKPTNIDLKQSPFREIYAYCEAMIASEKPEWQILAEQNGWQPPS